MFRSIFPGFLLLLSAAFSPRALSAAPTWRLLVTVSLPVRKDTLPTGDSFRRPPPDTTGAHDAKMVQTRDSVLENYTRRTGEAGVKDSIKEARRLDRAEKHDKSRQVKDSAIRAASNPRRATLYSTFFPGLGQIYNRKYWKVPLVYAAVGIPAYFFFDNKKWYKRCQYALTVTVNNSPADSVAKVDPALLPFVVHKDVNGIITNRDSFRKNQDYSVLFCLLFYGLQIVDATVDAHLRGFNISDDLSLKITPSLLSSSQSLAGVSLVFDIHKPMPRALHIN